MPDRIAELAKAVESTPGYESWEPYGTPESLEDSSRWFEGQVETRKRTAEEIEEIRAKLSFPVEIRDEELTNRTFSLAMDIGMYVARVVLETCNALDGISRFGTRRSPTTGSPSSWDPAPRFH